MNDFSRPITPPPPPPPSSHQSPSWPDCTHLTRDQRLQVKTLRSAGDSQNEISKKLEISRKKVRTAINGPATSQHKRSGRPSTITDDEKSRIID
jgi:transcriptional regulator